MKLCFSLIIGSLITYFQNTDISKIRRLYNRAAVLKADSRQLQQLMRSVDSNSVPVLYCYKGANEMIQAKYAFNPMVKLANFIRGKNWINTAVNRDTADLEMRFIRFSIQSNLPVFLGYRDDIKRDKTYLEAHTRDCTDMELKKMIINYLAVAALAKKGRDN